MKLKTVEVDGKTYAEVKDGKPVFIDDGAEIAFDAVGTKDTIKRLNAEAKGHREAKEAAVEQLKTFDGIDDPAAARKAMDAVKNIDDKKLVDAGEVEKVRAEAIKAVEEKYKPVLEERDKLQSTLRAEKIGGNFARSKYISEKLAVPIPMVEKTFGDHFSIEEGKIVAKDANGNQIYSKSRPGEYADFDEALETLVEGFAYRDAILKAKPAEGGEAGGGNGQSPNGAKNIKRSEFEKMDPSAQRKAVIEDKAVVVD